VKEIQFIYSTLNFRDASKSKEGYHTITPDRIQVGCVLTKI